VSSGARPPCPESSEKAEAERDSRGFPLSSHGVPIEAVCAACKTPMVAMPGAEENEFVHDFDCLNKGAVKTTADVPQTSKDESIDRLRRAILEMANWPDGAAILRPSIQWAASDGGTLPSLTAGDLRALFAAVASETPAESQAQKESPE